MEHCTFVSTEMVSVQWWLEESLAYLASFPAGRAWERGYGLLVFISTTLRVLLIPSADVHVWSAVKWPGLNLTYLTACYGYVMFAPQQPSECEFLRGVYLHCREMGMIYVRHWKQKAWVWISAMWLQLVVSVFRCTLLHNVWPMVDILVTSMLPNSNIGWPTKSWGV